MDMESVDMTTVRSEVRAKCQNKLLAVSEVVLVYTSVVGLMWISELIPGFESWQKANFGRAILSISCYLGLTGVLMFYLHGLRNTPNIFSGNAIKKALTRGGKSLLIMFLATFGFPIAQSLGFGVTDWGGAVIIGPFYLAATLIVLWMLKGEQTVEESPFSKSDARTAGWIFLGGIALIAVLHQVNAIARDILIALVFVGFAEEFLFRGYMQSRLNMAFGKPFEFLNLKFGWGIIIASALFGLAHVISPGENPMQWSWGFWTFCAGLGFGVIREKGGSFLAPAVVHGVTMIIPVVFS